MKTDYSAISNMKELREARTRLAYELKIKEKEVEADFGRLKQFLNPLVWVRRAFENLNVAKRLFDWIYRIYEAVRRFWVQKREQRFSAEARIERSEIMNTNKMNDTFIKRSDESQRQAAQTEAAEQTVAEAEQKQN